MAAIKDFLSSPLFYLTLAVVAVVVVLVFVRLRKMRLSEIEVGIPPKIKFQPTDKPAQEAGPPPQKIVEPNARVIIRGNKQIGQENKISVAQSHANVEDNLQLGRDQSIDVQPAKEPETR
jgi:hypothetical protein